MDGHSSMCPFPNTCLFDLRQMLKSLPQAKGILLFPTISHIQDTPNGRHLRYLFHAPVISLVSSLAHLLRLMPTRFLLRLIQTATGHSKTACSVTSSFITRPSVLYASLRMAREEMLCVRELDPQLAQLAPRLVALWARDNQDLWTPESHIEAFEKVAPGRSKRTDEDLPHAFCCQEAHSASVAATCWQYVKIFLESDHAEMQMP